MLDLSIDKSKFKIKHFGRAIAWIVDRVDADKCVKKENVIKELLCSGEIDAEFIVFGRFDFGKLSNYLENVDKKYLGDEDTLIIQCEV
jgi:hypothetical protein